MLNRCHGDRVGTVVESYFVQTVHIEQLLKKCL